MTRWRAKVALGSSLNGVQFMPYPYEYRCPFGLGGDAGIAASLAYIDNLLSGPEGGVPKPAGIIVEAVQGEGGSPGWRGRPTISGDWIVIELNDGQMSGLSMNDPNELYGRLAARTKRSRTERWQRRTAPSPSRRPAPGARGAPIDGANGGH